MSEMNLIQCHHTVQKMVVAEVVLVVASGRQVGTEVTKLWEALHYCTCNYNLPPDSEIYLLCNQKPILQYVVTLHSVVWYDIGGGTEGLPPSQLSVKMQ